MITAWLLVATAMATAFQPVPAELDRGVTFRIYQVEGDPEAIPPLAPDQTPNLDELRTTIDYDNAAFGGIPASFVSIVTGWIVVERAGSHAFRLTSDDGSRLAIGGHLLIDHDGRHSASALTGQIDLDAGMHRLLVEHFDHAGNRRLVLEWRPPGSQAFEPIPADALRTERDLTRVTSPGFKRIEDDRRPGDGKPVEGVHPAWTVTTIHPETFSPMVGAMAFASDGRLIVGTFSPLQRDDRTLPDIDSKEPDKLYALSGVTGSDPGAVTVAVAADGLYEPCGLCSVGDDLYVSHRKEITRLRDRDRDGFYETRDTVASGWEGWNYHQFVFGLVHRDGYLYATLSTAMAPPPWEGMGTNAAPNGPMRGGVLEVDLSSSTASVIAGGLRAPNGIGFGPGGALFYLDNQGAWMPTSQLAEVVPGRFYGHHNRTNFVPKLADRFPIGGVPSTFCDRPRTPAAVLLPHNELSNSPTQPQLVGSGLYAGQMYIGELTGGGIRRVFLERVNGRWQGAVFQFTQGLECGVNRLVWGPDGALYAGGIGAQGNWNWRGTKSGLQRLAPSGKVAFEILAVRARPDGFEVEFTKPVDRAWLADAGNYAANQWTYEPTAEYGGPKADQEVLRVRRAAASDDGRRVALDIPGLKPGRCVHLRMDPVSLGGEPIWSTDAWYTLNQIPAASPIAGATIGGRPIDPAAEGVGVGVLPPAHGVPLVSASADPVFRKAGEEQLARDGARSAEDLMALPGFVEMGSGDVVTSSVFGDARLHVEWLCPPGGTGQSAGNSGVYVQDLYEIQVLGTDAGRAPLKNDEAGAIYGVKAPDVNASLGPGEWQAFDVWFRPPRFRDGKKTDDARITVVWNGELVHNDAPLKGPTGSRAARGEPGAPRGEGVQLGPLLLQDHASAAEGPVRYRNVWIAPLFEERHAPGEWRDLLQSASADPDGVPRGWAVRGGEAAFRMEGPPEHPGIVGESRPNTPNTFLVAPGEWEDFELLPGPVPLIETRTVDEARLIIAKRLQQDPRNAGADPTLYFGPQFFEEFGGLSTRRILELAQARLREREGDGPDERDEKPGFISTLAAALGFGGREEEGGGPVPIEFREHWDRFMAQSEADIPGDDQALMDVLAGALALAKEEWGGAIEAVVKRLALADEFPAVDLMLRHASGLSTEARIFLCNRATQGGGLKRQIDRVLAAMADKSCFMLRASDFPPNKKNQTAQAFRKFREKGGRSILVPIPDWERMMMVREFHAQHRQDPGFADWFQRGKLLSELPSLIQLLRLDLLGRTARAGSASVEHVAPVDPVKDAEASPALAGPHGADWTGWGNAGAAANGEQEDDLPLSVLLDEAGDGVSSILAGRALRSNKSITLNKDVLKRHAAVLGGSGSGKTTLALCIIEQLLLKGTPAVLIDRKGDLCSYANPDVWRAHEGEFGERRGEREKLADSIDVAVYTPGRASGRPISITLLPNGINELPEQEQQLLANLSAAALGDMLHFKNSATHQKQSGTLSVALRILGGRFSKEVTLADLIALLEDEDPELTDLTQRMDPSGRIRRDLVAQLDSLRHRNSALFEGGGEALRMEALLGRGRYGRNDNRTRLSIIYTGFLGDNENILFWVSQFLAETLRFCQRNPNDELQAVVMFDEADLYIPANAKPATAEPLQSLLKRARSAGLGIMLATQSPGDLDYKSRDQITSWFIGRVREDTALRKLRAAFQSESGLDPSAVLPGQTVGEFHLVQEGLVRPMRAQRSLISAEQVPFDRIEQLARETKGQDEKQLKLFG